MKGLKRVKFHVNISGETWAFVPEKDGPLEIKEYLEECGVTFGGNKLFNLDLVKITDIRPQD